MINNYLARIADIITEDLSSCDDMGLFNGKTGLALFLFRYAKYTGNSFYEDCARKLLDEIAENIDTVSSPGFLDGLTGIGWGIEYLAQNDFIDADTNEVLNELDEVIFAARQQRNLIDWEEDGIFGYGLYFLSRQQNRKGNDNIVTGLLKKQILIFLTDECGKIMEQNKGKGILQVNAVVSTAYFLLEMRKTGIYAGQVESILNAFSQLIKDTHWLFKDRADNFALLKISRAIGLIKGDEVPLNSMFFRDDANVLNPINDSCKVAFHHLLYTPYFKNDGFLFIKNIIPLLDQKDNWKWFVQPSGHYNLSLNNGIAGIGLALLSSIENQPTFNTDSICI